MAKIYPRIPEFAYAVLVGAGIAGRQDRVHVYAMATSLNEAKRLRVEARAKYRTDRILIANYRHAGCIR